MGDQDDRRISIATWADNSELVPPRFSILNCSVHRGLSFTLTGQRNEQNECDECDVLFSVILYFLDFSILFIFHVSFTFNDIMTIMLLQSPTPKFHFNIICQHIECLCHQHSLQFQEMCAVLSTFHYILLYFLNLIYS